jgi:colanic acid/amylovoran biosynthesis glycosyltransferase
VDKNHGKILYLLHWFPAISETFILREIITLQNQGESIDIFSMNPSPDKIEHSEVEQFKGRLVTYKSGFISCLGTHLYWIIKSPVKYFGILWLILSKISHSKTVTVSMRSFSKGLHFARFIKESEYRHIHAHFGNAPATCAWVIGSLLSIPFSFTLHAVDVFLPDMLLVKKVQDAKFVAAISNFNIKYLSERFQNIDTGKITLVRCGIKPGEFRFRSASGVSKPVRLLSIGRMVETKGFRDLLDALKLLLKTRFDYQLTIIGGGEKLSEFKQYASDSGISDKVIFTGPLPQNDVRKHMENADIFVLACLVNEKGDRDGIPVVLMEALAMGIPTISTDVSGIPELVKNFDTGLVVPEKNPQALSDAILLFASENDLRKRLSVNGRRLVEEEFNIEKNASLLGKMFQAT